METKAIREALALLGQTRTDDLGAVDRVMRAAESELAALTTLPEDVERRAESFAKYHDKHAGYGGASWEFHARASTYIRNIASAAARVPGLEADNAALLETGDRVYNLAQHDEACRMLVGDDLSMCDCAMGDWQEIQRRAGRGEHAGAELLERLHTAESERDAARHEAQREQARADDATSKATYFEMVAKRLKANFTTTCRQLGEVETALETTRQELSAATAQRDEWKKQAEAQEALVEGWSDALGLEKTAGYDEAEAIREERDALRAKVAKLERQDVKNAVLEAAAKRLEQRADDLDRRVWQDEDTIRIPKSIMRAAMVEDRKTMAGEIRALMGSAPTPAPGGGEAVGPRITPMERLVDVARRLAGGANTRIVWDDLDAALAAYDSAPGGETCGHSETFWDASGPCGLCGADSEEPPARAAEVREMERTDYKAPAVTEDMSLPPTPPSEPTVTHAQLAAVVEQVAREGEQQSGFARGPEDDFHGQGMTFGAREVLRRVTGGQVQEVLEKARVVEVLTDVLGQREGIQRTHFMQVDMDEAEPLGNGWERAIREAGRMLGLTLPTGPGGESKCSLCKGAPDAQCPECGPAPVPVSEALESRDPHVTPEVPAMAQPEPAAPEVLVDTGACRVLADGVVEAWDEKREQWGPPETGWPINPVPLLARALAEAKRESQARLDLWHALNDRVGDIDERVRKAAEDMRERAELVLYEAAAQTRHPEQRDRLLALGHSIRALSLE